MKCLLFERALSEDELRDVKRKFKENVTSYTLGGIKVKAQYFGELKEFFLSEDKKNEIIEDIRSNLLFLSANNEVVRKLLSGNFCAWYYQRAKIFNEIRDIRFMQEVVNSLSQTYEEVIFYTDKSHDLIHFPSNVILFRASSKDNKKKLKLGPLFNFFLSFFIRGMRGLFSFPPKGKHVVINNASEETLLFNIRKRKEEIGNPYTSYLYENEKEFIVIDHLPFFTSDQAYYEKLNKRLFGFFRPYPKLIYNEFILFRGLFSLQVWKELKQFKKYQDDIRQLKEWTKVDLVLRTLVEKTAQSNLYFFYKYLSYKQFFSKMELQSISSTDENTAGIKAILDAAKLYGVKTIGIQHGTIHKHNMNYSFSKEDHGFSVVPDYTLVWGKYWKEFLLKESAYEEKSVIISGQLRTDVIKTLEIAEDKSRKELVVMYATQPFSDLSLRYQNSRDIIEAAKDIQDLTLLIRMHPRENEVGFYANIIEEVGALNCIISEQEELYISLSKIDALITAYSTVGTEVIYFNKPLITIDYTGIDLQGYAAQGVAFQCKSIDQIKKCFHELKEGKLVLDAESREHFIDNYAYKIDGKVKERILDFIKAL